MRAPELSRQPDRGWKQLIFWEFARGSWQYDLVVALILLFIFASPHSWFSDQPRASNITLIGNADGTEQMFLEANLLRDVPETGRARRAAELIHRKTGKRVTVSRVDPIRDDGEQELKGFIAYASVR